MAFVNEDSGKV